MPSQKRNSTVQPTIIDQAQLRATIRTLILAHVIDVQGCKATELAKAVSKQLAGNLTENEITEELNKLVAAHELIEIEYTLPEMPYRLKSFYLPIGTIVRR